MSYADPNIFMVEYWLNIATAAHLTALGVLDAPKQKDQNGLITPRIEIKTIWNGFGEHRYPNAAGTWFDLGSGKIVLKCVTRRQQESKDSSAHDKMVGTARYAMNLIFATPGYTPGNPNPGTISDRMPWHKIVRLIDAGATPSFVGKELQDVTAMGFDFQLQVRHEKFPTS